MDRPNPDSILPFSISAEAIPHVRRAEIEVTHTARIWVASGSKFAD